MAITPLVLHGKLVTFDPARPVIEDGALYIGADERIAAVQRRSDAAPSGFEDAARLETGGCVYPGLIDLHNHVAYNVLSLWSPPGRTEPYTSRYQWPDDRSYEGLISDPANALGALAGKAHLKYVEAKAVIGGVTAIQGSAKMAYPYEGWLVRNVEYETFKTGEEVGLPVGAAAPLGRRLPRLPREDEGRGGLPLPRLRGHRPRADRRVQDAAAPEVPEADLLRHPLHGSSRRELYGVGSEGRLGDLVAVLEPVALPLHDRGRSCPGEGAANLPRRRLVAVGVEEPAR